MNKFVRVMDGLKSNASGEVFKLDEITTAKNWNPNEKEPEKMVNSILWNSLYRWSYIC